MYSRKNVTTEPTDTTTIEIAGHTVEVTTIEGRLRIMLNQRGCDPCDGISIIDVGSDPKKLLISTDRIIRTDATTERMI